MKKIIIVLFLFLAASKGRISDINYTYRQILQDIKKQLNGLDASLAKHLNIYKKLLEVLESSAEEMKINFYEFEIQGELEKKCVAKYRKKIPNIEIVKEFAEDCWDKFLMNLMPLVISLMEKRNSMEKYWSEQYETEIKKCADSTSDNFHSCIDNVITNTGTNITIHKEEFDTLRDYIEPLVPKYSENFHLCNQEVEYGTKSRYSQIIRAYEACFGDYKT